MNGLFEPPISKRELPQEVRGKRELAAQEDERSTKVLEPRIEAHIAAYEIALQELEDFHQRLADETDLDLIGDTRLAAVWQMAGRCIGLARAILVLLRLGFCGEAVVLGRSLHEADRLLDAFADSQECDLLDQWLSDEGRHRWVRPRETREARDRSELRLDEAMRQAGVPPVKRTWNLSDELYDRYSAAAHNRRAWVQDAVSPDLRTMARGPHPSTIRRAVTIASVGGLVEEAVQSIGDALSRFYGPKFFAKHIQPLITSFKAMRDTQPLDIDSRR
jgi:hypothetical protein